MSCITCPRDLPDMYTLALGPAALGFGVHIRQITQVHDATITYTVISLWFDKEAVPKFVYGFVPYMVLLCMVASVLVFIT